MSLPPIGKDPFHPQPSYQDSKVEEDEKMPSDLFSNAETAVSKAVDVSIRNRKEKMEKLASPVVDQINRLEKGLTELRALCLEVCALQSQSKKLDEEYDDLPSDDESASVVKQRSALEGQMEELEHSIDEAENKMKAFIDELSVESKGLRIEPSFFSDWWQLSRIEGHKQETSLKFMEEQLLNRCVNQLHFLHDVHTIIEGEKEDIVQMFYRGDTGSLDLKQVSFELIPQGSETHNRGKVPVKIIFSFGKDELFSIFFKPRDAQIDATVIQIFEALNDLPDKEKSLDVTLPIYKISNMTSGQNRISLWEFIEGKHMPGSSASDALKTLPTTEEKRESLYQQLVRLESVCKFLNISDLHLDNLIFTPLEADNPRVIPIDLESIQPGNDTGLFTTDPKIPDFTDAERTLLEKSQASIEEVPVRFVPIPTSHFLAGLTRCDSFIQMTRFIQDSIQKKDYTNCVSKEELEWLVLNDFLHNDVPYLTEYKSQIYYGVPEEGNVIARRL